MSEVKRYGRIGDMVLATKGLLELYPDMTVYVKASDYDATQSELAALREELTKSREAAKEELDGVKYTRRKFRRERDDLQQRLTAAEQRNAELVELLQATSSPVVDGELFTMERFQARANARTYLASIKPTESGASE